MQVIRTHEAAEYRIHVQYKCIYFNAPSYISISINICFRLTQTNLQVVEDTTKSSLNSNGFFLFLNKKSRNKIVVGLVNSAVKYQ